MSSNYIANQIIATIDVATGAVINTSLYPLNQYINGSIQFIWSGFDAADSTVKMQTTDSNGLSFDDKSGTSFTIDSASGSLSLSFNGTLTSQAIRFVATRNSSTAGIISIYATFKE